MARIDMSHLSRTIYDARGHRRPAFEAFRVPPWRLKDDPDIEADLTSIRRDVHAHRPRGRAAFVAFLCFALVVASAFAVQFAHGALAGQPSWLDLARTVGIVFFVGMFIWLYRRCLPHMSNAEFVRLYLARGRCPSCGYKIDPRLPVEDGCRICPECSGVWHVVQPSQAAGESD